MAIEYITSIDDYKKLKTDKKHLVEAFKESADNFLCFEYINRDLVPKKMKPLDSLTLWCINLPSFPEKRGTKKCPVSNKYCSRI